MTDTAPGPGRLSCDVSTVEQATRVYALVRIAAPPAEVVPARPPLNLSIALDRSGSMFGTKLHRAVEAARFLVSQLSPRDRVSVVTYDERVETLVPPTLVENKDEIRLRLDRIRPGGTTNLSGAWLKAASLVEAHARPGQVDRVLLLTDGIANEGILEAERLTEVVRARRAAAGVTTTTFGLGDEFNEDLLLAMAEAGGGTYYFIENPDSSPRIFARELRGLLQIQAQNLCIRIDPHIRVKLLECLNGYPASETEGELVVELGDIYGEERKVLCIEMVVPGKADMGDDAPLARLRLEYDQIVPRVERREVSLDLHVNRRAVDPDAVRDLGLYRAARARERSLILADGGDLAGASAILKDASAALRAQSPAGDGAVGREIAELEGFAEQLDRRDYSNLDRKRLFTTTYYRRRGLGDLLEPDAGPGAGDGPPGASGERPGRE